VKTAESGLRKAISEPHMHMGKAWGFVHSYLIGNLTLARGSNED
jgi:hypothetical protein